MDWDTMRVDSFLQPDLSPLFAELGTGRVQDSLRDIVEVARGAETEPARRDLSPVRRTVEAIMYITSCK